MQEQDANHLILNTLIPWYQSVESKILMREGCCKFVCPHQKINFDTFNQILLPQNVGQTKIAGGGDQSHRHTPVLLDMRLRQVQEKGSANRNTFFLHTGFSFYRTQTISIFRSIKVKLMDHLP